MQIATLNVLNTETPDRHTSGYVCFNAQSYLMTRYPKHQSVRICWTTCCQVEVVETEVGLCGKVTG